ncbi:di-N-acetylchitobiase-like isoform X2 [Patiria miniata]|uniref:GH18 domain-containing protein n=1 Tax=Patiria miniata TaxID=46514 RepID=A0A913ZMQ7_PATMI|nr:di-N-acetylchitobiase-like isoform X2 [Patiria miniata]
MCKYKKIAIREMEKFVQVLLFFLLFVQGWCLIAESRFKSPNGDCPCSAPALCNVIKTPPRKEVFAFWLGGPHWMKYDWTKLTTVVMFGHYDADLMCYAHSQGVRVTLLGDFPVANLTSIADRSAWVMAQVDRAIKGHMDGINLDIEYPLNASQAKYLTTLVGETTKAFHISIPGSQVTFDVAWSPNCTDGRCYDYKGLADACDFLFVMSYDEQSQIYGDCIAMANSPYNKTATGVEGYLKLGIPANQLVLGVPWYGYNYNCTNLDNKDAATKVIHQVWYDDPVSLTTRYKYAQQMKLRGVGMWNADSLDYSDDPKAEKLTKAMWDAIGKYFLP